MEVCHYDKFGFCKYKDDCKRTHFSEECENLSSSKNMKTCFKRHPKSCKRFYSGQCKFGKDRAYKHEEQKQNEEQSLMIEKVKQIEKVVHALTRKRSLA